MGISRRGLFRRGAIVAAVLVAPGVSPARAAPGLGTAVTAKAAAVTRARDVALTPHTYESKMLDYAPARQANVGSRNQRFVYLSPAYFKATLEQPRDARGRFTRKV